VNYLGNEVMRERIADCRKEQGLSYAKLLFGSFLDFFATFLQHKF
jgi:hypothetical protein